MEQLILQIFNDSKGHHWKGTTIFIAKDVSLFKKTYVLLTKMYF